MPAERVERPGQKSRQRKTVYRLASEMPAAELAMGYAVWTSGRDCSVPFPAGPELRCCWRWPDSGFLSSRKLVQCVGDIHQKGQDGSSRDHE